MFGGSYMGMTQMLARLRNRHILQEYVRLLLPATFTRM
jgi:hypothetical protein